MDPYAFDIVDRDLRRHLKEIDREEMILKNELTIRIYDKDYGYGRIVLEHIDGPFYMESDIEGTLEVVKEFIEERMKI